MKKLVLLLSILPSVLLAQSNGSGKMTAEQPNGLKETALYKEVGKSTTNSGNKLKNGEALRIFEWFDFELNDKTHRYRRDFKKDAYFYDEDLIGFTPEMMESDEYTNVYTNSARLDGKKIILDMEMEDDRVWVYSEVKVYNPYNGLLLSSMYFENGRPIRININHYYANNQLQFVREITSEGIGEPLRNVGVQEAYYPDGSPFDNPITEDGTAIIILNDAGEVEDECACIDQDIMEWGRGYLYPLLGKYTIIIEQIYQDEGLECCWE
jgi:hypothetical protein